MSRQRALVTGAASGIGRALAAALVSRGDDVLLVDVDGERVANVGRELDAPWVAGDVGDPVLFDELSRVCPDPHVLCLNAGIVGQSLGQPWEVPAEDWDRVFSVNVRGVLNGLSAYLPRLVASGEVRSVLITGSLAGLLSFPGGGAYAASKHAVSAIAEQAALALADTSVRVTMLCPALVRTGMSDVGIAAEQVAAEALEAVSGGVFAVVPEEWQEAVELRSSVLTSGSQPTVPSPGQNRSAMPRDW